MNDDRAREYVLNVYKACLGRTPADSELNGWLEAASRMEPEDILAAFLVSPESVARNSTVPAFNSGHYYSPVVDPVTVREYVAERRGRGHAQQPAGITYPVELMREIWLRNVDSTKMVLGNFARYTYPNEVYPLGDALVLACIMSENRPKRIVEVGSGYSTACILDIVDVLGLETDVLCIEPYADRLREQVRDHGRLVIMEEPVQSVPLSAFEELTCGDILFIDSTHVLKTGSDVLHELFEILPTLNKGVMIHFHDVPFPFEYPDLWIFERNYSWNEAYALRAFLSFNNDFQIVMWGSLLAFEGLDFLRGSLPDFPENPGSGIWITRI